MGRGLDDVDLDLATPVSGINQEVSFSVTANASYVSPLTPDELLVALHNIDPNKCDMKTIIKGNSHPYLLSLHCVPFYDIPLHQLEIER